MTRDVKIVRCFKMNAAETDEILLFLNYRAVTFFSLFFFHTHTQTINKKYQYSVLNDGPSI